MNRSLGTCLAVALVALCASNATAQITQITAGQLVNPSVLDFDTGGPPSPGLVRDNEPYFQSVGLCTISIVNNPGMHTASSDTLSSGAMGNCIASVNNQLAIVAPGGTMDGHTAGAGWSFKLAPGTAATQFGGIIVDQTNHTMAVETWLAGSLQNSFTFTMGGGFPNPYIYFEDLGGFDEVRFVNTGSTGGWGIDDFTLANVSGVPGTCPPPAPSEWQSNQTGASLDINGLAPSAPGPLTVEVAVGSLDTLNIASTNVSTPWDLGVTSPEQGVALSSGGIGTAGGQTVNLDITAPSLVFLNGGANLTLGTPFPGNFSLPLSIPFAAEAAAQSIHVDPSQLDGFALSLLNEYKTVTCNPSSNFDSLPTGTGLNVAWVNGSNGNVTWTVNTGGTSSLNTGPTSAFSGPNYVYCETSSPNSSATFSFDTCSFDPANLPNFTGTVDFQLSAIGTSVGTLNVFLVDGAGNVAPTPVFTQTGAIAGQTQGGTEWMAVTGQSYTTQYANLGAPANVALRFEYTAGGSFTGDVALDDIVVQ